MWMFYRVGKAPTRTVVTYAQVASQLSTVLNANYPDEFANLIGIFKPFRDLFGTMFSTECAGWAGFENKWMLRVVVLPASLFALANLEYGMRYVTAVLTHRGDQWNPTLRLGQQSEHVGETLRDQARQQYVSRLLLFIFLTYPTVCNVAFSAMNCRKLSESVKTLVDDDRIVCSDSTGLTGGASIDASHFRIYQILSYVVIGTFGLGVPFAFFAYIKCATHDVDESVDPDPDAGASLERSLTAPAAGGGGGGGDGTHAAARRTGSAYDETPDSISKRMAKDLAISQDRARGAYREIMTLTNMSNLTEAYNPKYPWWETMDMLRKLSLVGFVVLVGRGSVAQVAFGNVLSFGFFAAHMYCFPMKTRWDNWLRAAAEVHVFWTITVAFVLRNDLSHELIQRKEWGNILIVSMIICVPVMYIVTLFGKWLQISTDLAQAQEEAEEAERAAGGHSTDNDKIIREARLAYCAYKHGLTTADDRRTLQFYCSQLRVPPDQRRHIASSVRASVRPLPASTRVPPAVAALEPGPAAAQPPPPRSPSRLPAPAQAQSRPVSPDRQRQPLQQRLLPDSGASNGISENEI